MYTHMEVGKLGEALCLYKLLQIPIEARLVEMGHYDIVADYKGRLLRIQVKTSQQKKNNKHRTSTGYQFCITKGGGKKLSLSSFDCDLLALVSVEQENCLFVPAYQFSDQKTRRITQDVFAQEDLAERSFKEAIASLAPLKPLQQYQSSPEAP